MYKIVRFFLFLFNPEFIHHIFFKLIRFGAMIPGKMWALRLMFKVNNSRLEREVFGLTFENPVGLAAGFDKDAKHVLGTINSAPFKNIWHNPQYNSFRQAILTGRNEIEICQNCSEGAKVWV